MIKVTNDEKYLITGDDDATILIIDLATRNVVHSFRQMTDSMFSTLILSIMCLIGIIKSVELSSDNQYIISTGHFRFSSIKVYNLKTRKELFTLSDVHAG